MPPFPSSSSTAPLSDTYFQFPLLNGKHADAGLRPHVLLLAGVPATLCLFQRHTVNLER